MEDEMYKKFLRLAYPEGYLPMKGVSTVDGWHISNTWTRVLVGDTPGCRWIPPSKGDGMLLLAMERGGLLPVLDPEEDPATWACALRDLANSGEKELMFSHLEPGGLMWFKGPHDNWNLVDKKNIRHIYFSIDADEPKLALVMAKAICNDFYLHMAEIKQWARSYGEEDGD